MGGALDLDQGIELVDLHACLLLLAVSQQVWQDGLIVSDVGTQRNCDWLAFSMAATIKSLNNISEKTQRDIDWPNMHLCCEIAD